MVEVVLGLSGIQDRMVQVPDLLSRLLNLGEAVFGVLRNIDGPVDLFESVQVLLYNVKVVLVVALQVDWAGHLLET